MKAKLFTIIGAAAVLLAGCGSRMPEGEVFRTESGKTISFDLYYHASLCINYDGYKIQIDPVAKEGVVTYDGMEADAILVTHEHPDHYNAASLDKLVGGNTTLVVNGRVNELYGKGAVMANGDEMTIGPSIRIDAVPAYNTTPEKFRFHPKDRDNGYVLTIEDVRIYIAGDTEPTPEMAAIKDIDIAFLPCNMPTMSVDQLVEAAKILSPKVLYPYHYSDTDVSGIPAALEGIDVRIRNMQ